MPSTLVGCSSGKPNAFLVRTGQTVTMKTFSTVKRTACLRGSSRKKHRDTQMSDGSTPRATPEMNMVSWTSSEIPSGTSKW